MSDGMNTGRVSADGVFGPCPHGGLRPYCPHCAGDEVDVRREERERRRAAVEVVEQVAVLRAKAARQSMVIDSLQRQNRQLRRVVENLQARRVKEGRRWRPFRFG